MTLNKFAKLARLQSPDEDNSGTDTVEVDTVDTDDADEQEPELDETDNETGEDEEKPEEDDELVVSFGEDPEPEPEEDAPALPNKLRKLLRESEREKKALQRQLEQREAGVSEAPKLGDKPTLSDCDFDEAEFEQKLDAWKDQKRKIEEVEGKKRQEEESQNAIWQSKLKSYNDGKAAMPVKDFQESEQEILDNFSQVQQSIIVKGSSNAAMMIYGLGKNAKLLKELAAKKDPVEFAWAAAQLEAKMSTKDTSKRIPAPEKTVSGGSRLSGGSSDQLEKLKEKARQSGDYSAYFAAKAAKK